MRKWFTIVLIVICFVPSFAQNLVPNNSFDSITSPPDDYAQICQATGWSSPSGFCSLMVGEGSPDFYHEDGSNGANPPNTFWATVSPYTGGGFAGFAPYYASSPNFREYVQRDLSAPLTVGTTYEVSFWITNGVSTLHNYGCNNIGVVFSNAPLTQPSGGQPITSVTPQCELTTVFYSTTWQKITFSYTATDTFKYICIGNFHNDNSTLAVFQGGTGSSGTYLYIDDVLVQPGKSTPVELIDFNTETVLINIWPNPSYANINLQILLSPDLKDETEIRVFDVSGRIQYRRKLNITEVSSRPIILSLHDFSPGVYLTHIFLNGRSVASEIVVVQ